MTTASADSPEVLALVREGLPLVEMLARQMRRQFGPYARVDDLASQGRESLLSAARSFDASRGIPFRRWANLRIRGGMLDAMRAQGSLPRRVYRKLRALQAAEAVHEAKTEVHATQPPTSAEAADAALGDHLATAAMAMAVGFLTMKSDDALEAAPDAARSPEEDVARAELLALVRAQIAARPHAERVLLERHYYDDVTFEEAARELGLSKSWASRLQARALEDIAHALRKAR